MNCVSFAHHSCDENLSANGKSKYTMPPHRIQARIFHSLNKKSTRARIFSTQSISFWPSFHVGLFGVYIYTHIHIVCVCRIKWTRTHHHQRIFVLNNNGASDKPTNSKNEKKIKNWRISEIISWNGILQNHKITQSMRQGDRKEAVKAVPHGKAERGEEKAKMHGKFWNFLKVFDYYSLALYCRLSQNYRKFYISLNCLPLFARYILAYMYISNKLQLFANDRLQNAHT